ncbi:MAG: hypothetical protein ACKV2Q_29055 [Planctomycetaceae bacterium]
MAKKKTANRIGPEHGTVGPELIKEAAKETVKGRGFDLLYILGFAFDPHVDQEIKNFGKLSVQICRMNPDLSVRFRVRWRERWRSAVWVG